MTFFNWPRCMAVIYKEFIQMRRDRLTFAMMIGIPLMQLILFGYAINTNPRHLPTAIISGDHSVFTRTFIRGLENTKYFRIIAQPKTAKEADDLLVRDKALFVVNIPPDFTRRLIRNERPQILIEADATDPVATANALATIPTLAQNVLNPLLKNNLTPLKNKPLSIDVITHAKYNPESITAYSIVPGLLGVVLTMTMAMITTMAITRERERGTMESLLSSPVTPLEVIIGKILPYIIVGYIQMFLILLAAYFLFRVPVYGNIWILAIIVLPFIAANLSVGLTFSSIAKNQLQAVQMTFFFFLPSILLSGFMFPFFGMPNWAQWVGSVLPLTYFNRIARGIMLKGSTFIQLWPQVWPILIFIVVTLLIGFKRFRRTLD